MIKHILVEIYIIDNINMYIGIQVAIVCTSTDVHNAILTRMNCINENLPNYIVGKINNVSCVITQVAIGILSLQRSVYDIMNCYQPQVLIYAELAYSRNSEIKIGDVVVSGYICADNAIHFSSTSVLRQSNAVEFKNNNISSCNVIYNQNNVIGTNNNSSYLNMMIISGYKYLCSVAKKYGAIIGIQGTSNNIVSSIDWVNAFNHVYHTDTGDNGALGFAYAAITFSIPFIVIQGISSSVYQPDQTSTVQGTFAISNLLNNLLSAITFNFPLDRINFSDLSSKSLGTQYGNVVSNNVKMTPPKVVG